MTIRTGSYSGFLHFTRALVVVSSRGSARGLMMAAVPKHHHRRQERRQKIHRREDRRSMKTLIREVTEARREVLSNPLGSARDDFLPSFLVVISGLG